MKNIFTSIIMFFIIIALLIASGLIGIMIVQEVFNINVLEPAVGEEDSNFLDNTSWYTTEEEITKLNQTQIADNDRKLGTLEIPQTPKITINKSSTSDDGKTSVNYDNVKVNKYFYKQLNGYSQTIYKAFESNKEQMKTGTHQVNLGSAFSDVLSKEEGQEKLGDYFQSAIEAYFYDNPDVFYLNPSKMYLNIETITKGNSKSYNVYINNGEEKSYLADEYKSKAQVEQALERVNSIRNNILKDKTSDNYKNIKMVHDYLVDNIEYDKSLNGTNIYDIYGALVNNKCVCEGYAKAFKYILDGMGIECTLVIGTGTNSSGTSENHAWNYVKLNGIYYAVDTTWDDPIVIGGRATEKMKYKYFLKGKSEMDVDHFPSGKFTEEGQEFTYPQLSYSSY